jgi:hypothetical protein
MKNLNQDSLCPGKTQNGHLPNASQKHCQLRPLWSLSVACHDFWEEDILLICDLQHAAIIYASDGQTRHK